MISNLEDTLIVLLVALLLFGGDKKAVESVKNLGKMWGEFKRRQEELKRELMRELNEASEPIRQVGSEVSKGVSEAGQTYYVRPYSNFTPSNSEDKIRKLEEEIRRLQAELERLKAVERKDGKN
ncbi:MAG: twin-arginine translocase TatA/TatE family subunit [Sulfolobus sp.]|nr:twin-arginine translocase TatA/TatE family subunit [Sulfolobus sp.]